MNQKKAYSAPDFEIFKFITESVLAASNTTTTKPTPPELPEDDFRGMKVF